MRAAVYIHTMHKAARAVSSAEVLRNAREVRRDFAARRAGTANARGAARAPATGAPFPSMMLFSAA